MRDGSELCNQPWSFGLVKKNVACWNSTSHELYIHEYPHIWAVLVAKMMKLIDHQIFLGTSTLCSIKSISGTHPG